ncbi:E3 ubiquitin-protein ligase RNF8-like [Coccinella septempunctata]|uniref:E3 ubiquitin-protein ligase RNF8-like n=1 Tax=Coccinella septempunctata TaxID=41139 RepID=UPI001D068EBA|nr:E3 ubiquitin-protein ligase RNF8-like [Coccinella septempunctata]
MSENPPKNLKDFNKYDGNQASRDDSDLLHSNSTPNLKRKRSIHSDTRLNELNVNKSESEVKKRKKDGIKQTSASAVASCSKEHSFKSFEPNSSDLKNFLQEELTCSICSELFIDAVTLNCSHSFCQFCIVKWMKEQSTCPVCRKEIGCRNCSLALDRFVEKLVEFLPEESKNHRKTLKETRENQKECDVPPVLDPADPDTEQLINDFLCWFGISEFMEIFDMRNQDEDQINYNHNENCTIN